MDGQQVEIKRALQTLFEEGDTIELRCVGHRTINGFYRSLDRLAADAVRLNEQLEPKQNVYVCLNPVVEQLYARRPDEFGYAGKGEGAADADVVCRRWLLVDVDPVRPTGVSATDEQKQAAVEVATRIYHWLKGQVGEDCLVCADSGNGAHLLIRLPKMAADQANRRVCEHFLRRLDERFSTEQARVDKTTFNAARICCLYGTTKRKGSELPKLPHRRSQLVYVPEPIAAVDWDRVRSLAGPLPIAASPSSADSLGAGVDVTEVLERRGVVYDQDDQYVTDSGERATRWELEVCPFDAAHDDRSAVIIQWNSGSLAFRCHHDGCSGRDWQALAALWELPPVREITAADIKLPAQTAVLTSHSSQTSHEFYNAPVVDETAFYGPVGEIVMGIRQRTEASPIAVLCCTLAYLGNALGRRYFVQLDQRHYGKLYMALVGATGSGRKGTADVQARRIVDAIRPEFAAYRHSGLSTGEGLLQVLDEHRGGMYPLPAMFTEREFASVLKRAERKGNTLSTYIRDAWDDEVLSNSTKKDPLRIEDHHVGLCTHVTPAELKRLLSNTDVANGFSNRFLWLYTRREGRRPGALGFQACDFQQPLQRLQDAVGALLKRDGELQQPQRIAFSREAERHWRDELYAQLDIDADEDTLLTLMCSRQAQQVCRLALVFALADGRKEIERAHLDAACAIADYVRDSVDYILSRPWWGDSGNTHDPAGMAPKLIEALQQRDSLPRTEVSVGVFQRHRTAREINALRDLLVQQGRLHVQREGKTERWSLTS